jgi:hypothetical protein
LMPMLLLLLLCVRMRVAGADMFYGKGGGEDMEFKAGMLWGLFRRESGDARVLLNGGVFSSKVESWAVSLENRLSSQVSCFWWRRTFQKGRLT